MGAVVTRTVSADEDGLRLDRWFRRHYPEIKHIHLEKLLRTGQVRLEGQRVKAGDRIAAGQAIRIPPLGEAKPAEKKPAAADPRDAAFIRSLIIHDDADFFVINKPAGLAVQGGSGTFRHIDGMLAALAGKSGEKPKLVHRLDRDTSGLLIIAKTARAAARFGRLLQGRDVKKIYWALVHGVPTPREGRIDRALKKIGPRGNERMVAVELTDDEAQRATTLYTTVTVAGAKFAWVALMPVTGRTHQLRAHMEAIGHPILGDPRYGPADEILPEGLERRLYLHAAELTIPRDTGRPLSLKAPPPPHFRTAFKFFGFSEGEGQGASRHFGEF